MAWGEPDERVPRDMVPIRLGTERVWWSQCHCICHTEEYGELSCWDCTQPHWSNMNLAAWLYLKECEDKRNGHHG